jgi:hypothetical protein
MNQCVGFPVGHVCAVLLPEDRTWCQMCRERRQAYEIAMLPLRQAVPVGVVLKDIFDEVLACRCGGAADSPDHRHSLSHAIWAWQHDQAQAQALDGIATVQHRQAMRAKEEGHDTTGSGSA